MSNFRTEQGISEMVLYRVSTTRWGGSPENVVGTLYDVTPVEQIDVSEDCLNPQPMVGGETLELPSVEGDVIALPRVENLLNLHKYIYAIEFDSGENHLTATIEIFGMWW